MRLALTLLVLSLAVWCAFGLPGLSEKPSGTANSGDAVGMQASDNVDGPASIIAAPPASPVVREAVISAGDAREFTVSGVVLEDVSHVPLHARLEVGSSIAWSDRATGRFRLQLPAGQHLLRSSCAGFRTSEEALLVLADSSIEVLLQPAEQDLLGVVVRDAAGAALPHARIFELRPGSDGAFQEQPIGLSDDLGRFWLPESHRGSCLLVRTDDHVSAPVTVVDETEIECGAHTTCRLTIHAAGAKCLDRHVVVWPASQLPPGPWRVGLDDGRCAIPRGMYGVAFASPMRCDLPRVDWFDGYKLEANRADVGLSVQLPSQLVTVVDVTSGKPLPASIELESLEGETWQVVGSATGQGGAIPVDGLQVAFAALPSGHARFVVRASGYWPETLVVVPAAQVGLSRRPDLAQSLTFLRDGRPYRGRVVLRAIGETVGLARPRVLFDGTVDHDVLRVPALPANGVDVFCDTHRDAPRLARIGAGDVGKVELAIHLPASAELLVDDVPAVDVVLRDQTGQVTRAQWAAGKMRFAGLWPGAYRLGPSSVMSAGSGEGLFVTVELVAGQKLRVEGCRAWRSGKAMRGRVQLVGQPDAGLDGLWILPWIGEAPTGGSGVLASAAAVAVDGSYFIGDLGFTPNVLSVYSAVAGGRIVHLSDFDADKLVLPLDCVRARIVVEDERPESAMLMMMIPTGTQGRSMLNVMTPYTTGELVDLGVLPAAATVTLMHTGGVLQVPLKRGGITRAKLPR